MFSGKFLNSFIYFRLWVLLFYRIVENPITLRSYNPRIQKVSRYFKEFQGVKRGFKEFKGVSRGFKGFKGVSMGYNESQGVSRGFKRFQ